MIELLRNVGIALGLWCVLVVCFIAVMACKRVLRDGAKVSLPFLIPVLLAGLVGYVLDIGFNIFVGWLLYLEQLPTELFHTSIHGPKWSDRFEALTFTARCSYHKRASTGWRQREALWWCGEMGNFDPGHCQP